MGCYCSCHAAQLQDWNFRRRTKQNLATEAKNHGVLEINELCVLVLFIYLDYLQVETEHIQLYLNGSLPTSVEEKGLNIGGKALIKKWITHTHMTYGMESREILRNKRMAAEMIRLMKEKRHKGFFFAVGAFHVTFSSLKNQNILDHLEAEGFHIERVGVQEQVIRYRRHSNWTEIRVPATTRSMFNVGRTVRDNMKNTRMFVEEMISILKRYWDTERYLKSVVKNIKIGGFSN